MSFSEPSRNTVACSTAKSSGSTPSSSGITGNTAAPSGTSRSASSAMSSSGDSRNDRQLVAVLDRRGEVVEIADVFVIQIEVDVLAHPALVEELGLESGELLVEVIESS